MKNNHIITLPIKRKFFDMILSGEKTEEYRDIKPFYERRFGRQYDIHGSITKDESYLTHVILKAGYRPNSPSILCELHKIDKGHGREEWGALPGILYYVLSLGRVRRIDNIPKEDIVVNPILDTITEWEDESDEDSFKQFHKEKHNANTEA